MGKLFFSLIHHLFNFAGNLMKNIMSENARKGKGISRNTLFQFNGKDMDFSSPRVMGILNITPDSFYDGGRYFGEEERWKGGKVERWKDDVEQMIRDGAYIVDIGAVSTRPGAAKVSTEDEKSRLLPVLREIRKKYPKLIVSIDTYRVEIAHMAIAEGADMINDISAGTFDQEMIPYIGRTGIPYVMMHIQGKPATMQNNPQYEDVAREVYDFLERQSKKVLEKGNERIIIDPGFGFGKSVEHNFTLLDNLVRLRETGFPILAGLSRKSMINAVLGTRPENALNGTTVLNTVALLNGADILRVHDVKEAVEVVELVGKFGKGPGA
jgi:dihydropteroate synthase